MVGQLVLFTLRNEIGQRPGDDPATKSAAQNLIQIADTKDVDSTGLAFLPSSTTA